MNKQSPIPIRPKTLICLCVGLAIWSMTGMPFAPFSWAEEASPSAYPEGSSSIIETRSWQLSGSDLAALHAQTKTAVAEIEGAVVVKDEDGLLVVSLPTQQLSELREKMAALGVAQTAQEKTDPQAPTTLLRLTFQEPTSES